jgi:ribosomal protein S18 acetylase RimI-like enzyme
MIRKATLEDLESVLKLEQTFGAEAFTKRSLRHFIENGSTLIIEVKDSIAGYAIVTKRKGSKVARLYSITIAEELRGRGYSKQLLSAAEDLARQWGLAEMRLEVAESNEVAKGLYNRARYHTFDRINDYYASGEACLRLKTDL